MSKSSGEFTFRKHDRIGALDAEDDQQFLNDCFEDTGDVAVLLDCSRPERIVLGRTGAGKSALLLELQKRSEFVITVNPEHLSLNYVANSNVLQYLDGCDINLDPFYKLLWRHVFAVTIIQDRFDIVDQDKQNGFLAQFREYFESRESKNDKHRKADRRQKALNYLTQWSDKFFQDVEHRTKAVAMRFESQVADEVKAKTGFDIRAGRKNVGASVAGSTSTSRTGSTSCNIEHEAEVIDRAKRVINDLHVQELAGIIELVDEVLDDPQNPCYIVIDRLDEQWADESVRYKLLKGLLDTVKEFGKVRYAKIIVCLRVDLLEHLFREVRSEAGFQEDKYRSLYLRIKWSREQLTRLIDKRICALIRDRYTKHEPTHEDVMPERIRVSNKEHSRTLKTIDFVLERTWDRPRDAIEFINCCIARSDGRAKFTRTIIVDAEGDYSRGRLRALAEEWYREYANLPELAKALLLNSPVSLSLSMLPDKPLENWALSLACREAGSGRLWRLATDFVSGEVDLSALKRRVVSVLHRTGIVGLKTESFRETKWADTESYSISPAELGDDTVLSIHPALHRVFGTQSN